MWCVMNWMKERNEFALTIVLLVLLVSGCAQKPTVNSVIAEQNMDALKQDLANGRLPVQAGGNSSMTLLHHAAYYGNVEMVSMLLDAGADVNAVADVPDNTGSGPTFKMTPLIFAARSGDPERVRVLVEAGADVNYMAGFSNFSVPRGITPLMAAARSGNGESVRILLDAGAKMDAVYSIRWLPGPESVVSGRNPITHYWLSGNAIPGGLPIHRAVMASNDGSALLALIRAGINVNEYADTALTPLHLAVIWDHIPASYVTMLLAAGADPNAPVRPAYSGNWGGNRSSTYAVGTTPLDIMREKDLSSADAQLKVTLLQATGGALSSGQPQGKSNAGSAIANVLSGAAVMTTVGRPGAFSLAGDGSFETSVMIGQAIGAVSDSAEALERSSSGAQGGGVARTARHFRDRGWLSIGVNEVNEDYAEQHTDVHQGSIHVMAVSPGGAADNAGIRKDDIILNFAGRKISSTGEFIATILSLMPGDVTRAKIYRDGKVDSIEVVMGSIR